MNAAGPTSPMIAPEPTNSPAPMTPPIAIIARWRCRRPFLRVAPSWFPCAMVRSISSADHGCALPLLPDGSLPPSLPSATRQHERHLTPLPPSGHRGDGYCPPALRLRRSRRTLSRHLPHTLISYAVFC